MNAIFYPCLAMALVLTCGSKAAQTREIPAKEWAEDVIADSRKQVWFDTVVATVNDRKDLARGLFLELAQRSDVESVEVALKGLSAYGEAHDHVLFRQLYQQMLKEMNHDAKRQSEIQLWKWIFHARALNDAMAQRELIEWITHQGTISAFDVLGFVNESWCKNALAQIISNHKLSDKVRFLAWFALFQMKDARSIGLLENETFFQAAAESAELSFSQIVWQTIDNRKLADFSDKQCIEYLKSNKEIFSQFRKKDRIVGEVNWKVILARSQTK